MPGRTVGVSILLGVLASLLAGCVAAGARAPAGEFTTGVRAEIDAIGRRAVEEEGIVGLSIGVAIDGRTVYARGFGHADADRTRPANERTVYDLASVGKHFTAAAALQLVEEGRLSLGARARSLIPELPANFPDATIEQLLRHTSGFVGAELDEANPPTDYATKRYGLELLTDGELQAGETRFAPDETWVYCNPGYLVLGMIVEAASGMRYDRYVRERMLEPNGLGGMTVCERAGPGVMAEAIRRDDSGALAEVAFIDMTAYSGQGSICSSVVDLLEWSRALNSGRIVRAASLERMRSPSAVRGVHARAEVPYGMAQRIGEIGGARKVGHTGTFDGGSASLAYYPERGVEVTVLSNTNGAGTPHAAVIERRVAKAVMGLTDPDVRALARPIPAEVRRRVASAYVSGKRYVTSFDGDELVVTRNGAVVERLVYVGGLEFRSVEAPDLTEYFIPDGPTAGWWVYNYGGDFIEVLRREELVIGPPASPD